MHTGCFRKFSKLICCWTSHGRVAYEVSRLVRAGTDVTRASGDPAWSSKRENNDDGKAAGTAKACAKHELCRLSKNYNHIDRHSDKETRHWKSVLNDFQLKTTSNYIDLCLAGASHPNKCRDTYSGHAPTVAAHRPETDPRPPENIAADDATYPRSLKCHY